jgi:hypothetical protein
MRTFTADRSRLCRQQRLLGPLYVATCTLLAISAATPSAESTPSADRTPTVQESPLRQYRAYRRMHAWNEKFGQEAWLECWTEFDDRGFRYDITTERGSEYVLNKVLKTLLRREQELIAEGQADRADLTPENYEFAEPAVDEEGQRYVVLKPKRKDVLLVDGRMVLNSEGTDVVRVEGRLSKNPSFWTSLVNVIRQFARLDGVRVPVSTESVAKLKLAGLSRMEVQYEYETINGRPISLGARQAMASTLSGGR